MVKTIPIVGMSPGNSYFTGERVKNLLEAVVKKYDAAAIFIPDAPSVATYKALGYPENIARRDKAIPKGNNLKNKSLRAIEALGIQNKVKIIDWAAEVETNPRYKEYYDQVVRLYESNTKFADGANSATESVLRKADENIENIKSATKIGVHYLLQELAFMEFAPELLQAQKAIYIYHKSWPVYESFITGKYDGKVQTKLAFEVVQADKPR